MDTVAPKFAGARCLSTDVRSAVDTMRRWPRLACRLSPAPSLDGHARVGAPPPVRPPRPVPTHTALSAPSSAVCRSDFSELVSAWSASRLVPLAFSALFAAFLGAISAFSAYSDYMKS